MDNLEKKIPLRKALIYVLLSVFLIWGSLSLFWWYRGYTLRERRKSPSYSITTIAQTTRNEPMKAWQLAELLELSCDFPANLYCFDSKRAEAKLQSCPPIKRAIVSKIKPNTLHIDYETRLPKAFIADYENIVCDQEGTIFPLQPFFSQKNLPEIHLGLTKEITWNESIQSEKLDLAFAIIDFVSSQFPAAIQVRRVDVHRAFALSAGEKEVIVIFEEDTKKSFVRLRGNCFESDLRLFLHLRPQLEKIGKEDNTAIQIVDLRSPGIALVKSLFS